MSYLIFPKEQYCFVLWDNQLFIIHFQLLTYSYCLKNAIPKEIRLPLENGEITDVPFLFASAFDELRNSG